LGRAGKALRQALNSHKISQNKLAIALGVERWMVFRWFHEQTDPTGETIVEIVNALKGLNPAAAQAFVYLYLGELVEDEEET
jgi:transcriptional regulator with XRE-family HTH domain